MRAQPSDYIEKMKDTFVQKFNCLPKKYKTPLERGDHPEVDDSVFLEGDQIQLYLTLIGQIQWLITLGRVDVFSAWVTLAQFRAIPRIGHLDRLKRMYGYICHSKEGAIRIRTQEPDFSDFPSQNFDWAHTIYGNVKEVIPEDAPPPLGKEVILSVYVDANLYHDLITGRALTSLLHFINQTPFDWYCKKQATVEDATFASEFNAARVGINQVIDNRLTLRYLGVPIKGRTMMFGDNESVITNATIPHSQLNKRHLALAYHKVREAVAADIIGFYHIPGESNPADIMSKIWGFQQVWTKLKALLFWQGETEKIPDTIATKEVIKQVRMHTLKNRGELYNFLPHCCGEMVERLADAKHVTNDVWEISFSAKIKRE